MHERNAKRLKGSTLYTVTLVMSVMIILMLTAIALSGAAYRRASSEYRDDQTNSTARSVVSTILDTLQNQSGTDGDSLAKALAQKLQNVQPNQPVTLRVTDQNGNDNIPGFGRVESVTFTKVNVDDESGYFIRGTGQNIIKVTATVSYGIDHSNSTTYTQYVTSSVSEDSQSGGAGGFIAAGGEMLEGSTGGKFFGESYTGIDPYAVSNIAIFRNPGVLDGGAVYNSSMYFTTGNGRIELSRSANDNNGVYINGSIGFLNNSEVNISYDDNVISKTRDLPYIFVKGTFFTKSQFNTIGNKGYNLFTGRLLNNDPQVMNLNANIFCYNTDSGYSSCTSPAALRSHMEDGYLDRLIDENYARQLNDQVNADPSSKAIDNAFKANSGISIIQQTSSSLLNWADTIVTEQKNGNVYSKGSVWMKLNFHVNDIVVEGALLLEPNNSEVTGDIYCDTLCIDNVTNGFNVGGTIHYKNLIGEIPAGLNAEVLPADFNIASKFPEGMSTVDDLMGKNSAHPDWKIIKTREEAQNKFYDENNHKYKTSENISHLNLSDATRIYYQSGGKITYTTPSGGTSSSDSNSVNIKESCTLVGRFQNATITIEPQNNTDLWINLFNFDFENGKIIVDDSKGKVNFFIPVMDNYCVSGTTSEMKESYLNAVSNAGFRFNGTNNSFNMNNGIIVTKNYYEEYLGKFTSQSTGLSKALTLKTYYSEAEDNASNMVPDIYIYAADNVETTPGSHQHIAPNISFTNQCMVTGNLISPYSAFTFKNSAVRPNGRVQYTVAGSSSPSNMANVETISWIGSVLVGYVQEIQNDFVFFYVAHEGGGSRPDVEDLQFNWEPLDGFVTY